MKKVELIGAASVVKKNGSYKISLPKRVREKLGITVPIQYPFKLLFFDIDEKGVIVMASAKYIISKQFLEKIAGGPVTLSFSVSRELYDKIIEKRD